MIATAFGSPLYADQSFVDMANNINTICNSFKQHMLDIGYTNVGDTDKFESLVQKILDLYSTQETIIQNIYNTTLVSDIAGNKYSCIYSDVDITFNGSSPYEDKYMIKDFVVPLSGTVKFESILITKGNTGVRMRVYINNVEVSNDDMRTGNMSLFSGYTTGVIDVLTDIGNENRDRQAYLVTKIIRVNKGDILSIRCKNDAPSYYYGYSMNTATLRCELHHS